MVAPVAIPGEPIGFVVPTLALDDQAHSVGKPLRRMRHVRREQQDFSCTNGYIHPLSILNRAQEHVALELVEELLARVVVVVLARIGPAYDHDDELARVEDLFVADWRPQVRAMRLDPLLQAESSQGLHVMSIRAAITNQGRCQARHELVAVVALAAFLISAPRCGMAQAADPGDAAPLTDVPQGLAGMVSAPDADAPRTTAAVWLERKLKFWFSSRTTFYSCSGLRDRAYYLLHRVGARPDMEVAVSCLGQIGPQQMPSVRITVAIPAEATPDVLATLNADAPRRELIKRVRKQKQLYTEDPLAQFPAAWRTVTIDGRRDPILEDADCEFVEQFTRQVLVPLGARVAADSRVRCAPHQVTMGAVKLKLEVLQRHADTIGATQ
jgi:hypothetical protein